MARSGTKPAVGRPSTPGARETREALVRGAVAALIEEGFAGASAREIARRAGCNQGLVFYHFGSVANLLLAALDEVSETRRRRYQAAVDRGARARRAGRGGARPSSRRTSTRATWRCWPR